MDNIFRSFFGFPNRQTGQPDDNFDHFIPPLTPDNGEGNPDQDGSNKLFLFTHPGDIFQQFDEMIANFDHVFRHFGAFELPPTELDPGDSNPAVPAFPVVPPQYGLTPRDKMLKHPDTVEPRQPVEDSQPRWFGRLWSRPSRHHEPAVKEDTDLDESVRNGGFENILGESEIVPHSPQRSSVLQWQSVSVRTHRTADGKLEETRTMVDGEGNKQTVVTRTMTGQTVRQTTKKNRSGETETTEDLVNMDENEKKNFDQKWNTQSSPNGQQVSPRNEVLREFDSDMSDSSAFGRLFGSDFKRFWNK